MAQHLALTASDLSWSTTQLGITAHFRTTLVLHISAAWVTPTMFLENVKSSRDDINDFIERDAYNLGIRLQKGTTL